MPYTEQYVKELNHQRKLFMLICVIAAIAVAILFWRIYHQQNELTAQAHIIQQQRAQNIFGACVDQNRRHDDTIRTFNHILAEIKRAKHLTVKQEANLNVQKKFNIELINALAPRQNCNAVVHKAVRPIIGGK